MHLYTTVQCCFRVQAVQRTRIGYHNFICNSIGIIHDPYGVHHPRCPRFPVTFPSLRCLRCFPVSLVQVVQFLPGTCRDVLIGDVRTPSWNTVRCSYVSLSFPHVFDRLTATRNTSKISTADLCIWPGELLQEAVTKVSWIVG